MFCSSEVQVSPRILGTTLHCPLGWLRHWSILLWRKWAWKAMLWRPAELLREGCPRTISHWASSLATTTAPRVGTEESLLQSSGHSGVILHPVREAGILTKCQIFQGWWRLLSQASLLQSFKIRVGAAGSTLDGTTPVPALEETVSSHWVDHSPRQALRYTTATFSCSLQM